MPKKIPAEETEIQLLIEQVRDVAGIKLSRRKIYSDVKRILKSKKEDREALFVEYYKNLTKQIFDPIAEKRMLATSTAYWLDKYAIIHGDRISVSMARVRRLARACCDLIEPGYSKANKHLISPESLKNIRDWEISELKKFNYYDVFSKTVKEMTPEVIEREKGFINDEFVRDRMLVDEQKIKNKEAVAVKFHVFSPDFKIQQNGSAAMLYTKTALIRDELASHGKLWHWYYSKKVKAYNEYLNVADAALKRIGFFADPSFKDAAIEYCKNTTAQTFTIDIDESKNVYKGSLEEYKLANIPVLTIGRERTDRAREIDKNDKTRFLNEFKPYVEKYGMKHTDFRKMNVFWNTCGEEYDKARKVDSIYEAAVDNLLAVSSIIIRRQIEEGKKVNVSEVLNDARKITNLALAHHTLTYDVDGILKDDELVYLYNLNDDKLKETVGYYWQGLDNADELINKYTEEMKAVTDGWRENIETIQKEDKEIAKSYNPPTPRTFDNDDEEIADTLFTKGYRPPNTRYAAASHRVIMETMEKKFFSGDKKYDDGAKEVFLANAQKIKEMTKFLATKEAERKETEAQMAERWTAVENELNNKYPDYQPKTMDDFEEVRVNIKGIDLNDNNNVKVSDRIEDELLINKEKSISNY